MSFQPWTEADAAVLHEGLGARCIAQRGRVWVDGGHRFWRPVDLLRPMEVDQARQPTRFSSGFHCLVSPPECATRMLPLKLIDDLPSYDLDRLARKRRQEVRKSLRTNEFQLMQSPEPLLEAGFAITVEARSRNAQRGPDTAEEFRRRILRRWELGPQLVIGGFAAGRLVGFILAHALGRTVYMEDVYISHAGRAVQVGSGMYFTLVQAVRGLDAADRVWVGFDEPDFPALTAFKDSMGVQLKEFPAVAHVNPGLAAITRRRRPASYARLTGRPLAG